MEDIGGREGDLGHGWRKGMGRTRGQMPRKPCPPSSPSFPRGTFFSFSHTPVFPLPRNVYFPKDGSGGTREGFSRGGPSQKWGLSLGFGWDPCLPRQARRVHVAHPFWSAPSRGVCPSGVFDRLPPGVSAESLRPDGLRAVCSPPPCASIGQRPSKVSRVPSRFRPCYSF